MMIIIHPLLWIKIQDDSSAINYPSKVYPVISPSSIVFPATNLVFVWPKSVGFWLNCSNSLTWTDVIIPPFGDDFPYIYICIYIYIWANYNISLTWILRPFGDGVPYKNHDSSEGEQWGRSNLPIYIFVIYYIYMIFLKRWLKVIPKNPGFEY